MSQLFIVKSLFVLDFFIDTGPQRIQQSKSRWKRKFKEMNQKQPQNRQKLTWILNIIEWTIIKESSPSISFVTSKHWTLLSTSQRFSNFILILFAAKHVDVVIIRDILQRIANACINMLQN